MSGSATFDLVCRIFNHKLVRISRKIMQKLSWVNHHASENMKKCKLLLRLNKTR